MIVDDDDEGGGIISSVSYLGKTPQQAIEAHRDKLNAALNAFFGQ